MAKPFTTAPRATVANLFGRELANAITSTPQKLIFGDGTETGITISTAGLFFGGVKLATMTDIGSGPDLGTAASYDVGTTEGTIAVLGAGGVFDAGMIPVSNILGAMVVDDAAARLALTVEDARGKLVVDADTGKSWSLIEEGDPSSSGDWVQIGDRALTIPEIEGLSSALAALQSAIETEASTARAAEAAAWQSGYYSGEYIAYPKTILPIYPGAMVYDFQANGNEMTVQMPAGGSAFVDRFGVVREMGSSDTATITAGRVQNISYDAQLLIFTTALSIPFLGVFHNPGPFSEVDPNGNVSFVGPFLFSTVSLADFEAISLSFEGVDFSSLTSVNGGGIADGFNLSIGTVISAVAESFLSALSSSGADDGYFTCTLSDTALTPEAEAFVTDLEGRGWTITITDP